VTSESASRFKIRIRGGGGISEFGGGPLGLKGQSHEKVGEMWVGGDSLGHN
jgi:hypothetical protein